MAVKHLVVIQVAILVACFGLEADPEAAAAQTAAAQPEAADVEPMAEDVLKTSLKENFAKLVNKIQSAETDLQEIMADMRALKTKYRKLHARVGQMPYGPERSAGERAEKIVYAEKNQKISEWERARDELANMKKDLLQQSIDGSREAATSEKKARETKKQAVATLTSDNEMLVEAKKNFKGIKQKMESAAHIPDTLVADTISAAAELDDKLQQQVTEQKEAQGALLILERQKATQTATGKKLEARQTDQKLGLLKKKDEVRTKLIARTQTAVKKLSKMNGENPGSAIKVSPCKGILAATKKKCYSSARTQVNNGDIISLILGPKELGSSDEPEPDQKALANQKIIARKVGECHAKAEAEMEKCTKVAKVQTKMQHMSAENTQAIAVAKSRIKKSRSAIKVATALAIKSGEIAGSTTVGPAHPSGLFVAHHSVYSVNSQGFKSLVKYPTIQCAKATGGIDMNAFEDEKGAGYFLDKKQSEDACDGPAYVNTEDVTVWINCLCGGVSDAYEMGGSCKKWVTGTKPWCYVHASCEHPMTIGAFPNPEDTPQQREIKKRIPAQHKRMKNCQEMPE